MSGENRNGTVAGATGPAGVDLRALARQGPVHFVGISGAGMSALAELVLRSGGSVTGCDLRPGAAGEALSAMGARITMGHDPAHARDAAAVVTTAAVPADLPELVAARERGIPVLKRAQALGALVNRGYVVAIAGTHGKTTTTAMTAAILAEAGLDPTAFVGGRVPEWGSGFRRGSDRIFVVEADEYDRSFHTLRPDVAVVTTVEADHLDVYGTLDAVEAAFRTFVEPVPADGLVAACVDDPGARRLLESATSGQRLGYGTGPEATLRAVDIELRGGECRFKVVDGGETLGFLTVGVPGEHSIRNALGAFAAARHAGASFEHAQRALAAFRGVGRRFETVAEVGTITIVDDYAHHPTEVAVTLRAARTAFPGRRIVAVFQPHLYSRTRDFATEFGEALAAADVVWVTDVYPAREEPIPGVSGELIHAAVQASGRARAHYHAATDDLAERLADALEPGDVCITIGAGPIDEVGRELAGVLGRRSRP
ncbi:MAG TPA: UDP-N-acetylmuramate--L-alanine ligase [Longimicrobiales bacterium]|nr:UDP-N-acetylmuramate--L-alanine ligase [Longimicrobiales bacterium]